MTRTATSAGGPDVSGTAVGFIGLGAMGGAMAGVLLDAGCKLRGYDVSAEALAHFKARGGAPAMTAAEAAAGAEALVIMVVNAEQTAAALFEGGALDAAPQTAVIISSATMPAEAARDIGARVTATGRGFLDAPVSGGVAGAEAGALTFMAAGAPAAFDRVSPLLQTMGRHIAHLDDAPGAGSTMKMVHQLAAGCNLAVAAEVMSFGAHLGLKPAQVLEILNVSAGGSWMISDRGPRMLTEGETAKSAVDIFVKDLGIVMDAARASRFPAVVSASALQVFLGASAAGFGRHDDSQAVRFYERLSGAKTR